MIECNKSYLVKVIKKWQTSFFFTRKSVPESGPMGSHVGTRQPHSRFPIGWRTEEGGGPREMPYLNKLHACNNTS